MGKVTAASPVVVVLVVSLSLKMGRENINDTKNAKINKRKQNKQMRLFTSNGTG